jgi:hypothetical protein
MSEVTDNFEVVVWLDLIKGHIPDAGFRISSNHLPEIFDQLFRIGGVIASATRYSLYCRNTTDKFRQWQLIVPRVGVNNERRHAISVLMVRSPIADEGRRTPCLHRQITFRR